MADAVGQADMILSATAELTSEQTPPDWMWPFPNELDEWFREVRRVQKERFGVGSDDDDDMDWDQNELTKGLR